MELCRGVASRVESRHSTDSQWPSSTTEPHDEVLIIRGVGRRTAADVEDVGCSWERSIGLNTSHLLSSPFACVVLFRDWRCNSHDNILVGKSRRGIVTGIIIDGYVCSASRHFGECVWHRRIAQWARMLVERLWRFEFTLYDGVRNTDQKSDSATSNERLKVVCDSETEVN